MLSCVLRWSQVRKLESQGVPTKQAEAITSAITEVLNDSLESISESFISVTSSNSELEIFCFYQRGVAIYINCVELF